jgi:ribose transport system permease protein
MNASAVFGRSAPVRWLRSAGTLLGFAALLVLFATLRPDVFLTPANLRNVLEQVAVLAVVASAQTVVMVVGDFDLSVGAVASLSGVLAATLLAQGFPLWLALCAVPLAGAAVGLVNGVLVAWFGLSAFVATLATMTSLGGLSLLVTSGGTLFGLPGSFLSLGQGEVVGVPVPVLFAIAVGGLAWLLLTQTTYGRRLHAVGGNAEVAAYSGIDPRRVRLVAFVLSSVGATVAGVLLASRLASAHPTAGDPLMLTSIAAVFIGMTVRRDNTPNVPGTLLGVVLLGVLANGLNLVGVSSYLQQVLTGLIIVTAVGLPKLVGGRS